MTKNKTDVLVNLIEYFKSIGSAVMAKELEETLEYIKKLESEVDGYITSKG